MSVYKQLEERCLPLMKAYQNDLVKIDREMIEAKPDCRFLHWTCETNTHLTMLTPINDEEYPPCGKFVPYLFGTADRQHILKQKVVMAEYFTKPAHSPEKYTCHYFTGKTLRQITVQEAVKIAKEYVRPIETKWHQEWLKNNRPYEYRQLRESGLLVG